MCRATPAVAGAEVNRMHDLPHRYRVEATAESEGRIALSSPGLDPLESAGPVEFGGPGDRWSPETLLMAAVADCFTLTFRAVAQASGMAWIRLHCEAEGTLDRVERSMRFTAVALRARLRVPAGTDVAKATRLLEKSERGCLISRSLVCPVSLDPQVIVGEDGAS
jgi:organic hydroperoxide reductase OsmC/OhrA